MILGARSRYELHQFNTRRALTWYAEVTIVSVAFAVLCYWGIELLMRVLP